MRLVGAASAAPTGIPRHELANKDAYNNNATQMTAAHDRDRERQFGDSAFRSSRPRPARPRAGDERGGGVLRGISGNSQEVGVVARRLSPPATVVKRNEAGRRA